MSIPASLENNDGVIPEFLSWMTVGGRAVIFVGGGSIQVWCSGFNDMAAIPRLCKLQNHLGRAHPHPPSWIINHQFVPSLDTLSQAAYVTARTPQALAAQTDTTASTPTRFAMDVSGD